MVGKFYCSLFLFLPLLIPHEEALVDKKGGRWMQYQTALSNTGPLLLTTTTTASTTTSAPTSSLRVRGGSGKMNTYNHKRASYFGGRNVRYEGVGLDGGGGLFENNTVVNVTVPLGDTAFLSCSVKNLGERSISWIRRRDWHILSTGKLIYTNDQRFHVLHIEGTQEWTLQIKFLQKRDNGSYMCQVSTGKGLVSMVVNLGVAVPEAFIVGHGEEYHVEEGSTIKLTCLIDKSPKRPDFIFWYQNERMINYGSSREVSVERESGGERTLSRLTIRGARGSDSGNYSCSTSNSLPASISVYVSQASGLFSGDNTAAIQRSPTPTSSSSNSSPLSPLLLFSLLLVEEFKW